MAKSEGPGPLCDVLLGGSAAVEVRNTTPRGRVGTVIEMRWVGEGAFTGSGASRVGDYSASDCRSTLARA